MKIYPGIRTPDYITNRGVYLWQDREHNEILVDCDGKFWGYRNNKKIKKYEI